MRHALPNDKLGVIYPNDNYDSILKRKRWRSHVEWRISRMLWKRWLVVIIKMKDMNFFFDKSKLPLIYQEMA